MEAEVSRVIGNAEKMQAQSFLDADAPRVRAKAEALLQDSR